MLEVGDVIEVWSWMALNLPVAPDGPKVDNFNRFMLHHSSSTIFVLLLLPVILMLKGFGL
jgi:hypothetical protein